MSTTISYKPASLMRRLFAAILDGVLIGLFGSVLLVGVSLASYSGQPELLLEAVALLTFNTFPICFFTEIFGFPVILPVEILFVPHLCSLADWVHGSILFCLLPLLISSIYHGLMESLPTKATLGKLALGIFVCDLNGNKISFMRAMFRYLAKGLSTLTCGVGYFMACGKAGQALHDKLTGCAVLSKE